MVITVFNAISHFLVDAACAGALFSSGTEAAGFGIAVIVYNTLAFSTQCLVGMLLDRAVRQDRLRGDAEMLYGSIQASAMFVTAAAAIAPLGLMVKAALLGLGNSLFHVSAGTVTLDRSSGKAAPLGIFVAPGAFGITIGSLFPGWIDWICLLLGIAAISCFGFYRRSVFREDPESESLPEKHSESDALLPAALLTAAVAVRAVGGSAAEFTWKEGAVPALVLTLFVFLGKGLGGFVCDRWGTVKPSLVTIGIAAALTAFFAKSMPLSLAGQFLINLSMPVTLWLLYRHLPDRPGLAFGLAASALWPGTLIGGLIKLSGPFRSLLIIICFAAGFGVIMYSDRRLRK